MRGASHGVAAMALIAAAAFLAGCGEPRQPREHQEPLRLGNAGDEPPAGFAPAARTLLWRDLLGEAGAVNAGLDGKEVAIAGYVVPLQLFRGAVDEFLLVPIYGACIHVPPPPPNQIVRVTVKPAQPLAAMSVVWVTGILQTSHEGHSAASSGYRIAEARIAALPR